MNQLSIPDIKLKGPTMFIRIVAVVILSILIASYPPLHALAIPFFIVALAIVFVIESVRVVPQQSAWVIEDRKSVV